MPIFVRHRPTNRTRRWVCAAIAVCMVSATPVGAAPGDAGDPVDCEKTTEVLHARGRYDEAANLALECWDSTRDPLFLFRAAKYWKRAGRHARAIHALKGYIRIAGGDHAKRLSDAKEDLRAEQDLTGRVVIGVAPALEREERVTITAVLRSGAVDSSPPLEYTFSAGDLVEVDLDPGVWDLSVVREKYEDKDETITVPPNRLPQSVSIAMATNEPPAEVPPELPPPPPPSKDDTPPPSKDDTPPPSKDDTPPPRPRTALKLGGGVAVGGGAVLLALAIGYAATVARAERRYLEICEVQRDEAGCYASYQYGKGLNVIQSVGFSAGALLLGAGIAMLAISARRKRATAPEGFTLFHMRGGLGVSLERRF